jgi:serine/threonine-protein kinase
VDVVGAVIGNYKIVRKLGEGGMGAVYLGEHALLGRKAAVKVLLPSLSSRADIVNRFFNEARAATSINDPGIVQIFDFGYHTDGSAFIVMEFLEGETLDARLHKLGRLPVSDALRITRQVASSLFAAHAQHIVHRDLKPENIFLVRDAEVNYGERPKILDFGIAKLSDDGSGKSKTRTGALMGTPVYMSPEQCRGSGELDHRSDIYALGCVLFHLIVGKPPFDMEGMGEILAAHLREPAPAPSSRSPGIPPEVDAIILHCLEKDPAARFQDMNELAGAIGQILPYMTAPGSPGSYPPAYHAGSTPLPSWRTSPTGAGTGSPLHGSRPPATPTTLGTSNGQVGGANSLPPRKKKTGLLVALAVVIAGGGGAAIAIGLSNKPTAAAQPDPIGSAAGRAIDAGVAVTPAPADASTLAVTPPDAATVAPAAVFDAAPALPPDAAPPPDAKKGSSTTTPPHRHHQDAGVGSNNNNNGGCDRTVDFDCDGIPDQR